MTNFNDDLYKKKYLKYKIKYSELKKQFGGTLSSLELQKDFQNTVRKDSMKKVTASITSLKLKTALN